MQRLGGRAAATGLAWADQGCITVYRAQNADQTLQRLQLCQRRGLQHHMVVLHAVQPERVTHHEPLQHQPALCGVLLDCFGLLAAQRCTLLGQLVLQHGHADVHGQGGPDQHVALGLR
ncbi:hypothetical protein SDC9_198166 [bioreactor metagenome]|uniref:Uncharacterized protein n=1 Tax=bioreactor metagenome TaxID=1076179 RepID=A0A645IJ82_9ZZZZ